MSNSTTTITSRNEMTEGLFGMVFLFMFEVLPILESTNTDVSTLRWDICTNSYGEIFPNLLEYRFDESKTSAENNIVPLFHLRSSAFRQWTLGDDFQALHNLFFKYFKVPAHISAMADCNDLTNCLGIHFRGTDKTADTNMNTPISLQDFYVILDSYLKTNPFITEVFLATDEISMHEHLTDKYRHIHFKTARTLQGNLFWRNNENVLKNGIDAMVDMLCLSKCKVVLKVSSALSGFSKVINPNLTVYRLNALKMFIDIPYFPDAYIPLLERNNQYSEECNKILGRVQQNDWSFGHKHIFNNFVYQPR